ILGFKKEAIAELEASLAGLERSLGRNSVPTILPRMNLVRLYFDDGDLARAAPHCERIVETTIARLAPTHPHIASTKALLAQMRKRQGRLPEAIKLFEEAFQHRNKLLGQDHANTLETAIDLAVAYKADKRTNDAIHLLEQVRDSLMKNAAPDDPKL